ncbi:MAG: hypothetical protein ABI895_24705, partial [Deltaproteobacteria bacterium]
MRLLRLQRCVECWIACALLGSCACPERASPVQTVGDPVLSAERLERSVAPSAAEEVESAPGSFAEWRRAALRIDALPEAARNAPFTRYVRALAAARMGQRARALELLVGLAGEL